MRSLLLLGCIISLPLSAKVNLVNTPEELSQAIARAQAGDRIVLADGNYTDKVYYLRNSGTKASPITIEAENPGKAVITGKSGFYIYGSHWVIKGLFFKDGRPTDELYTLTHPAQYNVFVLYGDHIRITECAIHNFFPEDVVRARYISSEFGPNGFPQFIRIDHCSFICDERVKNGQFIGINNSFPNKLLFNHNSKRAPFFEKDNDYVDILKNYPDAIGEAGQPLFCRIDHCYFGIYGGSISRWGHFGDEVDLRESFLGKFNKSEKARAIYELIPEKYRKKYRAWGGIVFDGNLVEGQRTGDAERICSKVGQNVYYNNTFINDFGFLSLRGGTQEVVINNYFLSNPPFNKATTGQITAWGQQHVIVGNYFRVNNMSGLAMTSGRDGTDTGHDTFAHGVVAYNTFEVWNPKAFALDLRSKYDRRKTLKTGPKEYAYATIYNNLFKGNTFIHTAQNAQANAAFQWKYVYGEIMEENRWEGNYYAGAPLGVYYHTNPQWYFMKTEQLETIEDSEITDKIVDSFTGVQPIELSSLLRDDSLGLFQNQLVKREELKIRNITTFPYVLSDLCMGKLTPIQLKGKLLPGALDLDLTDFGNYTNQKQPLGYNDVGPAWLKPELLKIGPKIRNYNTN